MYSSSRLPWHLLWSYGTLFIPPARGWLSLSLQERRSESEPQNRMEVLNILYHQQNHAHKNGTHTQQTCRLHSSACCLTLSRYPVPPSAFHRYAQGRTGYRMMMPAVPELRLIPAHTHTHEHTQRVWGRGETEAKGDLWQWVAHWPQNKKALGLRSRFMGRQWWCEIECLGQRGIYRVFNQIRLSVCKLPATGFPPKMPWEYRIISVERRQWQLTWESKVGHQISRETGHRCCPGTTRVTDKRVQKWFGEVISILVEINIFLKCSRY